MARPNDQVTYTNIQGEVRRQEERRKENEREGEGRDEEGEGQRDRGTEGEGEYMCKNKNITGFTYHLNAIVESCRNSPPF